MLVSYVMLVSYGVKLSYLVVLLSYVVKGLVHPKMEIKSLITHPHAVPTP